ncbi:SET domain-containing protein SmydA-8 [Megalopta genalis]|uniref:SET domain-containing protein SmydA-8 n=1 Tax=Megalopta genalis TaxID=115081 RepID=UPI003FD61CF4
MSSMALVERSKNCTPVSSKYNVARSEKLGRYLQSVKDLTAGEVILRERPVAVGPTISSRDYVCFGCLRFLPKTKKLSQHLCPKCNVALLCGPNCEEDSEYHTKDECEMFKNNKDLSPDNVEEIIGVLLPLRLWLLKQRDPAAWRQVECMEAHTAERRDTPVWRDRESNVINVIRALNLIPDHDASTSELLQQVCGILDVNVFELRSPGGVDGLFLRGLYTEASLMAHDCRGNTHLTVDDNFHLTVYASLPIQRGDTIFFNYTSSLLGTSGRREHLRGGKYFECECSLCKDPYEMGSYMSSILCPGCRQGYLGIENPLAVNPYEKTMRWQCDKCRKSIGGRLVRATLNVSRTLIEDTDDSDIKGLETLTSKLNRSFHPNHFLMLSLKQKLLAAYRKEMATPNPPKKCMQRMVDTCKEVCDVLEIVEPGISRLKGIMLYEMHLPLVLLANRAYAAREISLAELSSRLEEAGSLLKRSLRMLLLEPIETPEGKLAKRALQELKALNQNIADVKTITTVENTSCANAKRKSSRNKASTNK